MSFAAEAQIAREIMKFAANGTLYRGSKPVRAGNAAFGHLQLDIYGELMDSLYLYDKYGTRTSYDTWLQIERMLDWVAKHCAGSMGFDKTNLCRRNPTIA